MKKLNFALCFTLPLLCASCHFPWQKAQVQVVDCLNESLKKIFVDLIPQVASILTGGSPDWNLSLETMAKQYGDPALICAAQAVWNDMAASKATLNMEALSRAKQYIDSKKPLTPKL